MAMTLALKLVAVWTARRAEQQATGDEYELAGLFDNRDENPPLKFASS
jgi:hypothetical protein